MDAMRCKNIRHDLHGQIFMWPVIIIRKTLKAHSALRSREPYVYKKSIQPVTAECFFVSNIRQ
jgi:hypothetical protein